MAFAASSWLLSWSNKESWPYHKRKDCQGLADTYSSLLLSHFCSDKWKGYCSLNIPSQGSMMTELSKFMYLVRLDSFFTKNKYLTFVSSYLLRNKLHVWACSGKWLLMKKQHRYAVALWKFFFPPYLFRLHQLSASFILCLNSCVKKQSKIIMPVLFYVSKQVGMYIYWEEGKLQICDLRNGIHGWYWMVIFLGILLYLRQSWYSIYENVA